MKTLEPTVVELTPEECWTYLRSTGLGRLATSVQDVPGIFPVNYLIHEHAILFRSAPGSKLVSITNNPTVAFEVDGTTADWHWSVVAEGVARRLDDDSDIITSGVLELVSWSPTKKYNYVRITPIQMTGRRIDRHAFPHLSMHG